jgi:hypothetical protein
LARSIAQEVGVSRQEIEELLDRWQNEPRFRAEVRADPEGAIQRAGVNLDEREAAALRNVDWSEPDELLQERISSMGGC